MTFSQQLERAVRDKRNPVLVGLDPRWESLPPIFRDSSDAGDARSVAAAFGNFCRNVIDIVAPLVPAVKPQSAFFEQYGPHGMVVLADVVRYARRKGLIVILDGKRNDIGSTAQAYAEGMLGKNSPWGADALTVSPYLGDDSLLPFVQVAKERDAGIFVLVKTSNPGGAMLQDIVCEGKTVYHRVAEYVQNASLSTKGESDRYGSVGAVVGATWPEQLAELRSVMDAVWFLVPGFGSQGGSAKDVAPAFDENGFGAIVNNSRGIIFAHLLDRYKNVPGATNWESCVEKATQDMIEALAAENGLPLTGALVK